MARPGVPYTTGPIHVNFNGHDTGAVSIFHTEWSQQIASNQQNFQLLNWFDCAIF